MLQKVIAGMTATGSAPAVVLQAQSSSPGRAFPRHRAHVLLGMPPDLEQVAINCNELVATQDDVCPSSRVPTYNCHSLTGNPAELPPEIRVKFVQWRAWRDPDPRADGNRSTNHVASTADAFHHGFSSF